MINLKYHLRVFLFLLLTLVPVGAQHLSGQSRDLILTVVYDNNSYDKNLETRWGFSCYIKGTEETILFDVGGESSVLLSNMEKLKIDPKSVNIIVLSHIHQDHIGGLHDFLERNPQVTVYMPNSFPPSIKEIVLVSGAKLVEVSGPVRICEDVYSTGELGDFIKEQSLIVKTSKGLVIVTGCAHPGVVDIVRAAKAMHKSNVYFLMGGFHLCWMNPSRLKRVIRGVREEEVLKVAPCHCSGDLARALFKNEYGKNFTLVGAGKKIEIRDAF